MINKYMKIMFFKILFCNLLSGNNLEQRNDEIPIELLKTIDESLSVSNIDVNYFDKYLDKYPKSDFLIGMKGYFINFNISSDKADLFLRDEIQKYPELTKKTFTNLALSVVQKNDSDKIHYLKKSIKFDYNKINKWSRLELYYIIEDKNFDDALEYLNSALEIDEFFPLAIIEKAKIYEQNENLDLAKNELNKLINKYPYFLNGKIELANISIKANKFDEAIFYFNEVLKSDSTNLDALLGTGFIYLKKTKNFNSALIYFEKVLKIYPDNFFALKYLAILMIEFKDYQKSVSYFYRAKQLNIDYELQSELTYCLILMEDITNAKKELEILINMFGYDFRVSFFRILVLHIENKEVELNNEINEYFITYSNEDFIWLKSQLDLWGIDINVK